MRRTRRLVLSVAGLAIAAAFAHWASVRTATPLAPPDEAQELVVLIRPGPVVYFPGPDGALEGLDVDLIRQFAAEKNLPLRFILASSAQAVLAGVAEGRAHFGAGGLYRPVPEAPGRTGGKSVVPPRRDAADDARAISWTTAYATSQPVLIFNRDGAKPASWDDLDGETVAFADDAGVAFEIAAIRSAHPGIVWQEVASTTAALISQVSDGTQSYAVVGGIAAAVARNVYLDFEVAFPAGNKRDIAWAVSARYESLRGELDRFLARRDEDGTLARLIERYIPGARNIERIDASTLQERIRTLLPQYRALFRDAQERTGVEWRLLAALAYQESQWDPAATSETGVRGFMQITEDTARSLGIRDILDPEESVLGAARYLRDLKDKLPRRIPEPDRTWLALAAFNIGIGHLEDARVLAQKQKLDPDLWSDVKKVLPLLALPEYYGKAKLGYARGGMPVAFVDRVRGYYDVLLAREAPHQPRLRRFVDAPERGPGKLRVESGKKQ